MKFVDDDDDDDDDEVQICRIIVDDRRRVDSQTKTDSEFKVKAKD